MTSKRTVVRNYNKTIPFPKAIFMCELEHVFQNQDTARANLNLQAASLRHHDAGEVWLTKAVKGLSSLRTINMGNEGPAFYEIAGILARIDHNVTELGLKLSMTTMMTAPNFAPPENLDGENGGNFFKKIETLRIFSLERTWLMDKNRDYTPIDRAIKYMVNLTRLDFSDCDAALQFPLSVRMLPGLQTIHLLYVNMSANDLTCLLESKNLKEVSLNNVYLTSGFWAPIIRRLTELVARADFFGSFDQLGYQAGGPCWVDFQKSYVSGDKFSDDRFGALRSVNPTDRLAWSTFLKTHSPNLANRGAAAPEVQRSPGKSSRCAGVLRVLDRCSKHRPFKNGEVPNEDVWLCKEHANQAHKIKYWQYGSDVAVSKYRWAL